MMEWILSIVYEDSAKDFLELASNQRISIIFNLKEKKSKISAMAKKLDATQQEVSRNFDRLVKAGLIKKEIEGYYILSTFGRAICTQVPSLIFYHKIENTLVPTISKTFH